MIKDDKLAEELEELINKLKEKNEQYNDTHHVGGLLKTRKIVKESFIYSLVIKVI